MRQGPAILPPGLERVAILPLSLLLSLQHKAPRLLKIRFLPGVVVHTFNFRDRPLGSQSRSQKQDCPPPTIFNIIVATESILLNPLEVFMF